jgi:transposase
LIGLPSAVQIFVATEPVNLRMSFNGLTGLVRDHLGHEPHSGHLFCFRNRVGDMVKVLYWDRTGQVLWCKRLQRGTFRFPAAAGASAQIASADLMLILEGIDLAGARRRKRYTHST